MLVIETVTDWANLTDNEQSSALSLEADDLAEGEVGEYAKLNEAYLKLSEEERDSLISDTWEAENKVREEALRAKAAV